METMRTIEHDGRKFKLKDLTADKVEFIIEHETRGLFANFGHAATSGKYGPRFKNSDAVNRRSPEVWRTRNPTEALEMIGRVTAEVPGAYIVKMLK